MDKFRKQITYTSLDIISMFLCSRLIILLIGYFSALVISPNQGLSLNLSSLLSLFERGDSGWYMGITEVGYFYEPGSASSVAFFPLFPLLVKLLTFIIHNNRLAALIISNAGLLAASFYLYKLVRLEFKEGIASKAVLFMLISPFSFWFSMMQTEGLFLCLIISCLYYARKKQWLISSILGFFASLTRLVGVFIIIPLLLEYFDINYKNFRIKLNKIKPDILYLSLVPTGLLCYMTYLFFRFGNAFAFYDTLSSIGWDRKISAISTAWNTAPLLNTWNNPGTSIFYSHLFHISAITAILLIAVLVFNKVRISYWAYSIILLFVFLSSNRLDSIPRYIITIFPIYISLALLSRNRFLHHFLIFFSLSLLALFTILYTNNYYIV